MDRLAFCLARLPPGRLAEFLNVASRDLHAAPVFLSTWLSCVVAVMQDLHSGVRGGLRPQRRAALYVVTRLLRAHLQSQVCRLGQRNHMARWSRYIDSVLTDVGSLPLRPGPDTGAT